MPSSAGSTSTMPFAGAAMRRSCRHETSSRESRSPSEQFPIPSVRSSSRPPSASGSSPSGLSESSRCCSDRGSARIPPASIRFDESTSVRSPCISSSSSGSPASSLLCRSSDSSVRGSPRPSDRRPTHERLSSRSDSIASGGASNSGILLPPIDQRDDASRETTFVRLKLASDVRAFSATIM
eukprot:Amastigsp_a339698_90.p2 type:complete len:182 gc:universal Amastigsp_a339698_90:780-235(-)